MWLRGTKVVFSPSRGRQRLHMIEQPDTENIRHRWAGTHGPPMSHSRSLSVWSSSSSSSSDWKHKNSAGKGRCTSFYYFINSIQVKAVPSKRQQKIKADKEASQKQEEDQSIVVSSVCAVLSRSKRPAKPAGCLVRRPPWRRCFLWYVRVCVRFPARSSPCGCFFSYFLKVWLHFLTP